MRIRELIFQGVFGLASPCRLRPEGALARLAIPDGLSNEDLQGLLLATLYPVHLNDEQRQAMQFSDATKLAVVLETSHGVLRVIRQSDAASVRLQRQTEGGFDDALSGARAVQTFLEEKLHLPRLEIFLPLHLWQYDAMRIPEPQAGSEFGDDPRIPELVEMYLTSLEVESVEDELKELEIQVQEGEKALGQGAELEDKLQRAGEKLEAIQIDEMSAEEIALLESKEEKLAEFHDQLERLRSEEDTEQRQVRLNLPETPQRTPIFWVGIAVAVLALGASFVLHQNYRILALFSIPGFGLTAFMLLQYFNKMNRASVHQVRLSSIRRRIDQVLQEEILFRERIDHLMLHAGVTDEAQLRQRIPMAAKLRQVIKKIEEQLDSLRANPDYRRARKELTTLQDSLKALQKRRAELPEFVMNSYQLENDLETLGVSAVAVRKHADEQKGNATKGAEKDERLDTPFGWLQAVAQWSGQWTSAGLDEAAKGMWSKICGHVLSERFAEVDLSENGKLEVGSLNAEQLELWQRTRSSEVRAVQLALSLALHVNMHRLSGGKTLSSLWVSDPAGVLTPGQAAKFESVFKSAAKKSQIVICES